MREEVNEMIDRLMVLRSEVFKNQDEKLYSMMGRAIRALIEIKDYSK